MPHVLLMLGPPLSLTSSALSVTHDGNRHGTSGGPHVGHLKRCMLDETVCTHRFVVCSVEAE